MPTITDEKRDQRRAQILDAARKCFLREGLHATTMQDVIRASGLSTGAVYSYFKTKEEIIFAAVVSALSQLSALLQPIVQTTSPPAPGLLLQAITEAIVTFSERTEFDLKRLALLGWSEAQRNEQLRGKMRIFYTAFRDQLAGIAKTWQRTGMINRAAEPEEVAKTLLALILGFVVESAIVGDVDPETLRRGLKGLDSPAPEAGAGGAALPQKRASVAKPSLAGRASAKRSRGGASGK